jgi:hypothetical protein
VEGIGELVEAVDAPGDGRLEMRAKLPWGETRITGNSAHRECVHRIVARNRDNPLAVRHDDMLALPSDTETGLFKRPHCVKVIDAGDPRHS